MTKHERIYLISAAVSAAVAILSAVLAESNWGYFSGYEGFGRAVYVTLYVTIPFAIISFGSVVLLIVELIKRKRFPRPRSTGRQQ